MEILLQGYSGKMGKVVRNVLKKKHHLTLADFKHSIMNVDFKKIDVIVDFSSIEGFYQAFYFAKKYHIPLISGTTGLSEKELKEIDKESKKERIPVYVVANFLPIFSYLKHILKEISSYYSSITLEEIHHQSKKDKPSGTAKEWLKELPKEKIISISSIREECFLYKHTFSFYSSYDSFTITHQCYDKIGYAKGVEVALNHLEFVGLKTELPWKD